MEDIQNQLLLLINEGEEFTFQNFCYPNSGGLQYGGVDTPEWFAWKIRSLRIIQQMFHGDSPAVTMALTANAVKTRGNYQDKFECAKNTMIKALQLTLEASQKDTYNEIRNLSLDKPLYAPSDKVFVVHCHDNTLKTEVENFLRDIGLEPIILHKKPDEGQTIIEKFEKHSDVGYAFILLTPDEIAYTIDQEKIEDKSRKKEKRARPNVIFEFGYFIGRLGRKRVCCLYKSDVLLPSDLHGLLYKKIENAVEDIGFSIIKELKTAGYNINL